MQVRAYISGEDLEERFMAEMRWWEHYAIAADTGEKLFTFATTELGKRVLKWINDGEVADPEGEEMYTNIGTLENPHWISRRDSCKVEGSNTLDHNVFQPGHTASQKAHRRMLLSVARRNHDRQVEHRGAGNFHHYNFKLVDKLQGLQSHFEMLDEDSAIGKWRPPTGKCFYLLFYSQSRVLTCILIVLW